MHWQRSVKYRLRSLDDSTATVLAEVTMSAGSQALSVEPNATTRVTSGTVVEELTVPLRALVPSGTARGTTEVNFSIVKGHARITSTVRAETTVAVQRAD